MQDTIHYSSQNKLSLLLSQNNFIIFFFYKNKTPSYRHQFRDLNNKKKIIDEQNINKRTLYCKSIITLNQLFFEKMLTSVMGH